MTSSVPLFVETSCDVFLSISWDRSMVCCRITLSA